MNNILHNLLLLVLIININFGNCADRLAIVKENNSASRTPTPQATNARSRFDFYTPPQHSSRALDPSLMKKQVRRDIIMLDKIGGARSAQNDEQPINITNNHSGVTKDRSERDKAFKIFNQLQGIIPIGNAETSTLIRIKPSGNKVAPVSSPSPEAPTRDPSPEDKQAHVPLTSSSFSGSVATQSQAKKSSDKSGILSCLSCFRSQTTE